MYEETVKRLQDFAAGTMRDADAQLAFDAVNAIEELEFACNRYEKDYKALCEYLPKWIPVTERLPEDGKFVLVCNDDGNMMIAKHETETYDWYYKYTKDDFDIWDNEEQGPVRYWMPLPQAPKGG